MWPNQNRFPNTVELSLFAMLIAIIIGALAGIISASRQYSIFDYTTMGIALFGVSVPVFWLGIMLMMIFGVFLRWLPISGRIDSLIPFQRITGFYLLDSIIKGNFPAFVSTLRYLILPSVALSTIPLSIIARMTRSSMLEVLRQDYVRTARAKGLLERLVVLKHALRNALLPVVTIIGLQLGTLFAGAVLTESIFSLAGVGRMLFESITARDFPVVQAFTVVIAVGYVAVNLIVDLSYVFIDPRIRLD